MIASHILEEENGSEFVTGTSCHGHGKEWTQQASFTIERTLSPARGDHYVEVIVEALVN